MTETGNITAGQDLAGLKLPELRKIASEQGLKGTSGLRKSELIQAITTGKVPGRAAAAHHDVDQEGANHTSGQGANAATSAATAGAEHSADHSAQHGEEPQRQESRAAARDSWR